MADNYELNNASESSDSAVELDNFCRNFTFMDTTCCHCNRFCVQNFDSPVCVSCHKFIFRSRKRKRHEPCKFLGILNTTPASLARGEIIPPLSPLRSIPSPVQPSSSTNSRIPIQLKDLNKFFGEIDKKKINNDKIITCEESATTSDNVNVHIYELPVEMMGQIFSYLSEDMLFVVSKVSQKWERIVAAQQKIWKKFTKKRWPLLQRKTETTNWFKMYVALKSSCCCRICVDRMMKEADHCIRDVVSRRARKDVENGLEIDDVRIMPLNRNLTYLQGAIVGPPDSPYEGGIFYLRIYVPEGYPFVPPVIQFSTKIIHPNVSRHGDIGLDSITCNYAVAMTLSKLLLSIQSLLSEPFTQACMEPELGRLYDNDRRRFNALARHWTKKYAMMDDITLDD